MDPNEIFDNILRQEESSYDEGVREGTEAGRTAGYVEGYSFGWTKGWEIGAEVGFYRGYAGTAREMLSADEAADGSPAKKIQAIEQLLELLSSKTFQNVNSDSLAEYIAQSRKRFRQIFPGVFRLPHGDTSTSF